MLADYQSDGKPDGEPDGKPHNERNGAPYGQPYRQSHRQPDTWTYHEPDAVADVGSYREPDPVADAGRYCEPNTDPYCEPDRDRGGALLRRGRWQQQPGCAVGSRLPGHHQRDRVPDHRLQRGGSPPGAAFPRLTRVGGYLCIMGNRNLATLGTAFPVLGEFGTHSTGISLFVYNNAALRSLGTAFASLRRIPGTLLFNEIPC